MYDRIASKPGRVLIKPEDGSPSFYATITMADEPTQAGTPPIKANLLTDATANLLNLGTGATVNDALNALIESQQWKVLADVTVSTNADALSVALKDDLRNYNELTIFGSYLGVMNQTQFRTHIGNDTTGTFIGNTTIYGIDYIAYFAKERTQIVNTEYGTAFLNSAVTNSYNGGKIVTSAAKNLYLFGTGGTSTKTFYAGGNIKVIAR